MTPRPSGGGRGALVCALLAAAAGGCGAGTAGKARDERVAPAARTAVRVAVGPPRQRFEGWGAGIVTETRIDPMADPSAGDALRRRMDDVIFRQAGITLLRIWSPGDGFGSRDGRLRADDGRFALMRRAPRRVRFMLTGGDAPDLKDDDKRLLDGAEDEYARRLIAVLAMARRDVGVPFSAVAVGNEVDNRRLPLNMTPEQAAKVYRRLAADPAGTPLVLGDNTGWDRTARYVPVEAEAIGDARPLAVASHAYTGSDADRRAVVALAAGLRAPVWMTEWTDACPRGDCPDDPSIEHALTRAVEIVRDLDVARASAWFAFRPISDSSHGADESLAVRYGTRLVVGKRLAVFRQFSWAGRPGSRVHRVAAGRGGPTGIAFSRGRRLAVVLVNDSSAGVRTSLALGRRAGRVAIRRTDAQRSFSRAWTRRYRGPRLALTLTPRSATTAVLTRRRGA